MVKKNNQEVLIAQTDNIVPFKKSIGEVQKVKVKNDLKVKPLTGLLCLVDTLNEDGMFVFL
jgi:hypothetical protein